MTEPTAATAQHDEPTPLAGYEIHVGTFAGPLDLLLHLVRINEVEIADIPIFDITRQYHEHLELMREMNLEVAGEYLVMAATLMHIKSQMLLPPEPGEEDEEASDPRAELAQQLIDYQSFKQAAENLQAMESRRSLIWTRRGIPADFEGEELLAVDMFDLLRAFEKLLGRLGEEARIRLRRDTVSVAEKMEWLTQVLSIRKSVAFLELLAELPTRLDRVATFLAILELMRLQQIVAFQRQLFGEIFVTRVDEPEEIEVTDSPDGESHSEPNAGPGEESR